jgi:hypothetical protein
LKSGSIALANVSAATASTGQSTEQILQQATIAAKGNANGLYYQASTYSEIQKTEHQGRISRIPTATKTACDNTHAWGSTAREDCYKTYADKEFGVVTGNSCRKTSECDSVLNLCCGVARPTNPMISRETN